MVDEEEQLVLLRPPSTIHHPPDPMARDAFRFLPLFLPGAETARQPDWQPALDVYRSRTGWLLKFDLAGVRPQDIELTFAGSLLIVRGVRRDCVQARGYSQYRM